MATQPVRYWHKISPKAQRSLDKVVQKFQSGDLSEIVKVARITRDPDDDCPMAHWSLGNIIWAYLQSGSLDCRGYKQWLTVGRPVQKGTSAAYIRVPCTTFLKKDGKFVLENGEKVVSGQYFKWVAVHPLEHTEGEELPTFDYLPKKMPPLTEIAQKMGIDFSWVPLPANQLGNSTVDGFKIRIGTHDPDVWFHELAHAVHAKIEGGLQGGQTEQQETVADFTAAVLMWFYGYGDRTGNCWQYIQHYAKDPLAAVSRAISTVTAILEILEV